MSRIEFPTADQGCYELAAHPDARVLLFSERNFRLPKFQVPQYEWEDVIAEVDRVRMIAPRRNSRNELHELAQRGGNALRELVGSTKEWPVDETEIDGEYDLFFAVFHFPHSLAFLDKIPGWRKRCKKAVAYVVEMWSPEIRFNLKYLRMLDQFDQVFLFNGRSIENVAPHTDAPLAFLPLAADAIKFCPYPRLPERTIDVYSVGRRSPSTHDALLRMAERDELFYLYDTIDGQIYDYRSHRLLQANFAKRSRYFVAYRINEQRRSLTGGEEGLATRWFEGTAGGAVLIGSAPRCPEYDECFDWPDATIEIPYETTDVRRVLAALDAEPERLAAASRNNVLNALRRHDWLYRWERVLDSVGLPHTAAMRARRRRLDALAAGVSGEPVLPDDSPVGSAPVGSAEATVA
ncbi:MAG: glycosyltransferase [Gemmatimonadaceae bacterium]